MTSRMKWTTLSIALTLGLAIPERGVSLAQDAESQPSPPAISLQPEGDAADTSRTDAPPLPDSPAADSDPVLNEAAALVEKSDRYLHHDRLKRGMKGYGLSVFAGTDVVRFDVEIVSVVKKWGPHQDVVLVRLSGQNLERDGVSAGMSGSPVYITDPSDGKDKLIGAVAYGFVATKESICGVQPIAQMLAVGRGKKSEGNSPSGGQVLAPAWKDDHSALMSAVMDWRKADFMQKNSCDGRDFTSASSTPAQLVPLITPLAVGGLNGRTLERLGPAFRAGGFLPVQAGGAGAIAPAAMPTLTAGSAMAVQLISGDVEMCALGTVTDVSGDKVLAFGHAFFGEGDVEFPISQAYVHTVIPTILQSFKIGSATDMVGSLVRDEALGVAGTLGRKAAMIPMTLTLDWKTDNRTQQFHYQIAKHHWFTPMLAGAAMMDATESWRSLPAHHTVSYQIDIDFESLGHYRASNVSSQEDFMSAASDVLRPLVGVLNNPFSDAPAIRGINVAVRVEEGQRTAEVIKLELDGNVYRPGETVTGKVTLRPYRKDRTTLPVEFILPDDLPDGNHTLTACDAESAIQQLTSEMPQRFAPRKLEDLFQAMQRLVDNKKNFLYLRMPLPKEGLAIGARELPDLPQSRSHLLTDTSSRDADIKAFRTALETSVKTPYVLTGSATAEIVIQRHPRETLTRQQGN